MGQFIEYCKIAFFNLKSNKVRAFLTMLGIIIGISSVVMIISLGGGVSNSITGELDSIAGNYIELVAMGDEGMTQDDLDAIQRLDSHVSGTCPMASISVNASFEDKMDYRAIALLGSEMFNEYSSYDIIRGRYFTKEEYDNKERLLVINKKSARQIFGSVEAVGKTLDLTMFRSTETYRIIGVRDDNSDEMGGLQVFMTSGDYDIQVEVPMTSFIDQTGLDIDYYDAVLFVDDASYTSEVSAHAKAILEARHDNRGENQYMILNLKEILSMISSILSLITVLIMLVAGISLFVGGIGVMNIMLVSVTERTREIGIRKALGARTGSILTQFLVESASISLCGGIIGTLIGLSGAQILCIIISKVAAETINADINVLFIMGIALFSMSIGIVFGIIPARKAAKLSPIDALRHK